MRELPNESVHLVITSPPYFCIKDYTKDGYQKSTHAVKSTKQIGDIKNYSIFIQELLKVWNECERVLKPNGKLIINTPLMPMKKSEYSTHYNRHIFNLDSDIQNSIISQQDTQMYLYDMYIWERTNPSKKLMFGSYPYPRNFYAQNTSEFISVYVKDGQPKSRVERALKEKSKLTEEEWIEYTKQIWRIPIPGKNDIGFGNHTAIMPETIVRRCVRLFTFVDDVVLDPFAGSGTTLKVAKEENRKYVGYEIMSSYRKCIDKKLLLARSYSKNTVYMHDEMRQMNCLDSLDDTVARESDAIYRYQNLSSMHSQKSSNKISKPQKNKIYQMDCFNFLSKIENSIVDLAVIDPPYNMNKDKWDKFKTDDDFFNFTFGWIDMLVPKLKDNASLYIFNTPYNSAFILSHLVSLGLNFQNWITWDKRDGLGGARRRFSNGQETILFLTKGIKHTFNYNDIRIPYDSTERINHAAKKGILKNGKRWFPNPNGKLCGEVWHITSARHKGKINGKTPKMEHVTPKPLDLIERIIMASSSPGDIVLDCFAGSGTTAVAAKNLGRDFLCCELQKEYAQVARNRLKRRLRK